MLKKLLFFALLAPFVGQLWGAEGFYASPAGQAFPVAAYYVPYETGIARYKIEAVRALASPELFADARRWSVDPRVQELIVCARALDTLVYDGFRLVRTRGVLTTTDAIDASAIYRTVMYFNVSPAEAHAWLLASRLMQMSQFKDDGVALSTIESEMGDTAIDLRLRLQTYFNNDDVRRLMPRFAWMQTGATPFVDKGSTFVESPRSVQQRALRDKQIMAWARNNSLEYAAAGRASERPQVTTASLWPVGH